MCPLMNRSCGCPRRLERSSVEGQSSYVRAGLLELKLPGKARTWFGRNLTFFFSHLAISSPHPNSSSWPTTSSHSPFSIFFFSFLPYTINPSFPCFPFSLRWMLFLRRAEDYSLLDFSHHSSVTTHAKLLSGSFLVSIPLSHCCRKHL